MAKKSAASKGYRKTIKKKPFLTKKEIIACVAVVAAVALAIILFNLLYDDGNISQREVQPDDIVSYASRDVHNRYRKLGTANALEGFTREDIGSESSAIVNYYYTPEDEESHIEYLSLGASFRPGSEIVQDSVTNLRDSGFEPSEVIETTIQGAPAYVYFCNNNFYDVNRDPEAAEAEAADTEADTADTDAAQADADAADTGDAAAEPESNVYSQSIYCYVQCPDNYSLTYSIYMTGEDDSYYLSQEEVLDTVLKYSDAFTLVQPEEK